MVLNGAAAPLPAAKACDAENSGKTIFYNFNQIKMQTKKMSLANIQGKLSRAEMKSIMAGSGDDGGQCGTDCADTTTCVTGGHNGHCHKPTSGPNAGKCFCTAVY